MCLVKVAVLLLFLAIGLKAQPDSGDQINIDGGTRQIDQSEIYTLEYPKIAERFGIEGRVLIRVLLDTNGKISEFELVESDSELFTEQVVKAVKSTVFEPAIQDGKKVRAWVTIPVNFRLKNSSGEAGNNKLPKVIKVKENDTTRVSPGDSLAIEYKLLNSEFEKMETRNIKFKMGIGKWPPRLEEILVGMALGDISRALIDVDESFLKDEFLKGNAVDNKYLVFVIKVEKIFK